MEHIICLCRRLNNDYYRYKYMKQTRFNESTEVQTLGAVNTTREERHPAMRMDVT